MPSDATIDQTGFRRILARNVFLPLAVGVTSAGLFVAIIVYLLSVLNWVEHTERVIGNVTELSKLTVDQESGVRGFLLTNEESFLTPYSISKGKIRAAMPALLTSVKDNPTQVQRLGRIEALQQQWEGYAVDVIALRRTDKDFLSIVKSGRGRMLFDAIRAEFKDFFEAEENLLRQRKQTARNVTGGGVALYLAVIIVLSGLLVYWGRRDLTRLSEVFGDTLRQHQAHGDIQKRQAWVREGQTKLADRSVGQLVLTQLSDAVLTFLAEYTGAAVAAMYVREDDGSLKRTAGYGAGKEFDDVDDHVDTGRSLLGQAVTSKRLMHIANLPDHYLKVNSALGIGNARSLVLLPVENNGVVNAVIELGFLAVPGGRDLEFLDLVASNIGSAVEAAKARLRLQHAFAATQQLNEELQVQQEELRTANEELEEQSRILKESQALLENQKAELEQTNDLLVDQAATLDQKNSALNSVQSSLKERALDLQRASRYKSEFLANMSHELRTPLNSALILSKLLAGNPKGNLDVEQVQFANTIYAAGNDLLNLINDILDISKVEAGKLELSPEAVALPGLSESLRMTFEPLASQKQLQLNVVFSPGAPASIYTDRQRLEQIIKNLLSNAIKFTETGVVSLTIDGHTDMIAFAVTDSGIGIANDQQAIIFEAFRQADGTTSRRYGGTGLGLSISRDLAALLGGSITVSSEEGKGSTFTLLLPPSVPDSAMPVTGSAPTPVVIPLATPSSPSPRPMPLTPAAFSDDRQHDSKKSRTVLVIEDDAMFARILYDLAHEMHYRCLVAHTAADGLQTATDFLPDAILLDLGLPDGSGMDVLHKLKSNPYVRHIPVHIVSAADRAEAAMQLGAVGYAIKPATRKRLKEVFNTLERKFTQKVKRVLLVEDDVRQRESVIHLIGDDDVDITAVASGEEGLALLRIQVFDCMIIDLKLPDMQGHELLQKMAAEEVCSFPPVIVYTGRNLTRAEEADLLKYSRSIIIKGARSPERLLDEVTLFLHKVESQMSAERQRMLKSVRNRERLFEGRRVLLVDDDVRNVFSLTSALEQKGLAVEVGRNGFEALAKLDEVPDIDLVLMDVMMPGMDGLEATRRLRADPRFAKLPIIAITAKAMKDDQEQCIKAGASDYLAKPIDLDRLYSLMRVWLPDLERLG